VIRVSLEIRSGTAHFRAAVGAESIERALGLASKSYPGCEAKVIFPINPEAFFAEGSASSPGTILPEVPEEAVG
jgi:hypothetical protein